MYRMPSEKLDMFFIYERLRLFSFTHLYALVILIFNVKVCTLCNLPI